MLLRILWLHVANAPPAPAEEFIGSDVQTADRKGTAGPRGGFNQGSGQKFPRLHFSSLLPLSSVGLLSHCPPPQGLTCGNTLSLVPQLRH